ncbi:variable surface protein Vir 14-related [Plasmodium vivax]|uniref:Variable surface protein Vir 14-related n=1 Tax=Plasmodium vivax (strain Salvador I) TaxID=126793 RepID=A5KD15_PLAVS|nr:variable surface protein Vir 14-related [Plasmodium vivax]EDL42754.1 variable surface protein Vir 14-related [Plasmodium vivax]|eukprot:XP_001612547.1 variable surface protein Vir 14-related [Plasmodium vivax Sal-1]
MFDIDSGGNQAEADDETISESTIQGDRIIFHHLPAYKFEQELKEDANGNIYNTYFNSLSRTMARFQWSQDLYNKLSRNIKLVHDRFVEGDEFNKKRCYDLNFWLYNEVFNNLKSTSENDTKFFKDISTRLQEVWKNVVDANYKGQPFQCYPDKALLLNMGYLQEVKDLFDFFQDYNEMKKEIIADTYKSCRRYLDYLKQRIPVYYTWRDSCKVDEFACKRYIDDYMKYRPASIVPDLNPLIVLWYPYTPCYQSVYDLFVKAKEQPKRNDGIYKKKMEKLERLNPGGNLLLTDMGDGLRGSEFFIPGDHDDYWLRLKWDILLYITDDITPPLLGIVGVLLILWALYKFTPIGKSVRRTRAKVRKRIRPNINYDDIKLLYGSEESLNSSTDSYDYNNDYDYDDSNSNSSYNFSYSSSLDY